MKTISLAFVLFVLTNVLIGSNCVSNKTGGGTWALIPSWSTAVPSCGDDTIHIAPADVISVLANQDYEGCSPILLIVDGTLLFPNNGPKLKLPANSTIIVNPGGLISGPGGDNSNKVSIGGTWVWESGSPDVVGPALLGKPLPIELLSFDASVNTVGSVELNWATVTEINNDFFTIEKSIDGFSFESLGTLAGSGNSSQTLTYNMIDNNPYSGISYYRLKQTDFNGEYSYSGIKAVNVEENSEFQFQVYPNPTSSTFSIEADILSFDDVKILNSIGQEVTDQLTVAGVYQSKVELDLSSLNSGLYFVQINNTTERIYKQ